MGGDTYNKTKRDCKETKKKKRESQEKFPCTICNIQPATAGLSGLWQPLNNIDNEFCLGARACSGSVTVGDASAVASDAKPFVDLTWEDDNSLIQRK